MRTLDPQLFRFWGWNTQGDFGPYTFYTKTNNALTFYLKAPPHKPPSPLQTLVRAQLKTAAALWAAQLQTRRQRWELATKRAHLRINGYNLWIYWQMTGDAATIQTVERQTSLALLT